MRRPATLLLLLLACKEEPPVTAVAPANVEVPAPETPLVPITPTIAASATTSRPLPVKVEPLPAKRRANAIEVRRELLARRKQLNDRVRGLGSRISKLEATLKLTGPRNDQRDVLNELGRSRGDLAKIKSIEDRCEAAFDSEEWNEVDGAWELATDMFQTGEQDAAEENFQLFIELAAEFRAHCQPLEPIKGAR